MEGDAAHQNAWAAAQGCQGLDTVDQGRESPSGSLSMQNTAGYEDESMAVRSGLLYTPKSSLIHEKCTTVSFGRMLLCP
jgi:hypothetical protein